MSQGNSQQNLSEQLTTYFKGVKNEWGKVSWPTKQQVVADTIIVLLVVTFFTIDWQRYKINRFLRIRMT